MESDWSALIAKSQAGDKEAREELTEKNLGLVHHIVRRFTGRGHDLEDLFQIGVIGLLKAIDKFDLELGLKFSTYAVPMITGEIKRFLRDDGPVKVSRTLKENGIKVKIARQSLLNNLNRDPTLREISLESGLTVEEIVMAMEADSSVESLYSPIGQEDGNEMFLVDKAVKGGTGAVGSTYSSGSGSIGNEDYEKEELLNHMLIEQLLQGLNDKERELIILRYFQDKTQIQVAGILGISQVQVSRLEKKILLRLREQVNH